MTKKKRNSEEEEGKELVEYSIKGKVRIEKSKTVSFEVPIVAYAVRNRKVLGSAPVNRDGSFEIEYRYKGFGKDKEPYGVDLIIGPELPGDQILKTKFERIFLSSKGFKKSRSYEYIIDKPIMLGPQFTDYLDRIILIATYTFTYCGFVYTCSPLQIPPGGQAGCVGQEALSSADAEAYVRLIKGSQIIGEDIEIDITGRFEKKKTYFWPGWVLWTPVRIEVYQKTDEGEHTLYTADHHFQNNIAEDIFIDRDTVEIIPIPSLPTPGPGDYFGFERIGNVVVEAIYKEDEVTGEFGSGVSIPDEFIGYVNSVDKPGLILSDSDLRVKDYAFGGSLHLYANIGEGFGTDLPGGVDMSDVEIKYFRIKYTYEDPETGETISDTYWSVPFNNTRKTPGGTTPEFMGPLPAHPVTGDTLTYPTYIYPNPYDTDPDRDWKYRGLVMVLNTATLPRRYGRYTLTLEPLDADLNPVAVADADENCVLTVLIDNDHDAFTGEIKEIWYYDGIWKKTGVCDIADITGVPAGMSEIKVKYTISDSHGNLRRYKVDACYGKDKDPIEFTDCDYSRSGNDPYWHDVDEETIKNLAWQRCAYQFRIRAWRKVTNGFHTLHWKEFTYYIYIDSNNPYVP
jgi:hypothetical protein